jgi:A/G-specific adenine glycosylase
MAREAKRPEPRTDAVLFRRKLLRWYRRHGRDLPWRQTRDPYAILVSEVMLQQTRVETVIPYYRAWLRRFPTVRKLAHAAETDVLHAWQGLGYYTRARNLHAAAKLITHGHRGRFPREAGQIRKLAGVGKYTANAVASFAFDQSLPIVEANTARVLARLFDIRLPIDQTPGRTALWDRATSLIPKSSARVFNSALIDLGASVCLPRPRCSACPVRGFCRARDPGLLPQKRKRPSRKNLTESHSFAVRHGKILLEQSQTRWRGMWILPRLSTRSTNQRPIHLSHFPFTHHRVRLAVFRGNAGRIDKRNQQWFSPRALRTIPMPSPHRRALDALL